MDGQIFDDVTRRLALGTSRRSVLRGLLGLGAIIIGARAADARAQPDGRCSALCKELFSPGPERGRCVSQGARGEGPCAGGCAGTTCVAPSVVNATTCRCECEATACDAFGEYRNQETCACDCLAPNFIECGGVCCYTGGSGNMFEQCVDNICLPESVQLRRQVVRTYRSLLPE